MSDRDAQRRADRWNKRHAGKRAGKLGKDGYNWVTLPYEGKRLRLRCDSVAWAMVTGDWPIGEIIHINGDNADDRFVNLRDSGAAAPEPKREKPPGPERGPPPLFVEWVESTQAYVDAKEAGAAIALPKARARAAWLAIKDDPRLDINPQALDLMDEIVRPLQ